VTGWPTFSLLQSKGGFSPILHNPVDKRERRLLLRLAVGIGETCLLDDVVDGDSLQNLASFAGVVAMAGTIQT